MHIQCTKKMLDFLKPELSEVNTKDDIFAWHINYKTILRKKFIVLINDLTRYSIVLYGLKKSDFKDPVSLFKEAILETMIFDGFPQDLVMNYINGIEEITYGKTKDRKLVSQLNRAMMDADFYAHDGIYDQTCQFQISRFLNRSPVGTNNWKEVHYPKEKMLEYLELI